MKKFTTVLLGTMLFSTIVLSLGTENNYAEEVNSDITTETSYEGITPTAGWGLYTTGKLTASGSANSGMTLDDSGKTRGALNFEYTVSQIVNVDLLNFSHFYVELPEEFRELASQPGFSKYVSGEIKKSSSSKVSIYDASDIEVVPNTQGRLLRFKNPTSIANIVASKTKVNFTIDLGAAVTNLNVRIPDANPDYKFHAFFSSDNWSIFDWTLIGENTAGTALGTNKIDPAYAKSQEKPKIDTTYTSNKVVTGTATPGAKVVLYKDSDLKTVMNKYEAYADDTSGNYKIYIDDKFLDLEEGQPLYVVQISNNIQSSPGVTIVQKDDTTNPTDPEPKESSNVFKTGYWSDNNYYLAIEGQFYVEDYDFTNSNNTKFYARLVDSNDNVKLTSGIGATTNWYDSSSFDGYQVLLESNQIAQLPDGEYKVQTVGENNGVYNTLDMTSQTILARADYKHVFSEIEPRIFGNKIISCNVNSQGVATITVATLTR